MESVEELIRGVPFFRSLDRVDLARLTGALEEISFSAGELIFGDGDTADALYLLEAGRVAVSVRGTSGERSVVELEGPAHFGELGLLLGRRTGSVRAVTSIRVWKLPRERFERAAHERSAVGLAMARSLAELVDRRTREYAGVPTTIQASPATRLDVLRTAHPSTWRRVSTLVAIGLPLALWRAAPPAGLTANGWHVGLIALGAVVAWLTEPVPDFVVALAMVTAWGLTGLVPLGEAMAGFTSPSYVVALSALGLAAAMIRSGLMYRAALRLLQTFPPSYPGQVLALLCGGLLITPLMPLSLGRVAALAPLTLDLSENLGYPPRSPGSAGVAFAGIFGYAAFSSIFFTGLAMNFYVFALMPPADHARFSWFAWLASAAPTGLILFLGAAAALLTGFRPPIAPEIASGVLERQRHILGPLTTAERITMVGVAVLLVGLVMEPVLRVDSSWMAALALVVVLTGGVLARDAFRDSIEWGFLVLFGVLLGTGGVFHSAGVDRWIGDGLVPLAQSVGNPGLLIILLATAVVAFRLVVPWIPATLLLSLALVPVAPRVGLSPWVVGFVILVAANAWLLPRQSDYCRLVRDATLGEMYTERQAAVAGAVLTVLTLLGLALSIPYWRLMGVIAP